MIEEKPKYSDWSLDDDVVSTFMKRFNVPGFAKDVLNRIFYKEEVQFISALDTDIFTAEQAGDVLKNICSISADDFLANMYRRGVISYTGEDRKAYSIADLYVRLDVMGVTEQEQYRSIPKEMQKKLADWSFHQFLNDLDPDPNAVPTQDEILPLEDMLKFMDSQGDRPVYTNNCDCKSLNGECGMPRDVCITYKTKVNSYVDRGAAKKITPEEAKAIVRRADNAGLMHTKNRNGICNCCGDCCVLFRGQKVRGSKGIWPVQHYLISYNAESCKQCGLCIKRCWMGVFTKNIDGKIEADPSKCVGCGICATKCPGKALTLKSI